MNDCADDRMKINVMIGPGRDEVGCDECFEILHHYVDLELAGENAAARMPRVHAHFEGCGVCWDEYESLRELAGAFGPADLA